MSDPNTGKPTKPEEVAREELRKERDDFLKAFFRKGVELTEELVRERDQIRQRLLFLEEENTRLRAQVASGDAIRELLQKIGALEDEKDRVLRQYQEAQVVSSRQVASFSEVENELANLANLYVASYQLHASFEPREVLQTIKDLLAQFIGAEAFAIYLHLHETDGLVLAASEGVTEGELPSVAPGQGLLGGVFSSGRMHLRDGDPRLGTLEDPVVVVPLRLRDKGAGLLVIFRTLEQKHAFIQVDHELLKLLGAQAISALIAAQLFHTQDPNQTPLSSLSVLGILSMAEFSCLIVEDSPMMRQLLVFALARVKSLRVTEADDGVDALRKLAASRFDIIITDINMPIMDGLKLVKRIRSDQIHKDTPIVIITTEGSQEDRQRALQLGANAYITKPIQAPQVIAKVKELLKIE